MAYINKVLKPNGQISVDRVQYTGKGIAVTLAIRTNFDGGRYMAQSGTFDGDFAGPEFFPKLDKYLVEWAAKAKTITL